MDTTGQVLDCNRRLCFPLERTTTLVAVVRLSLRIAAKNVQKRVHNRVHCVQTSPLCSTRLVSAPAESASQGSAAASLRPDVLNLTSLPALSREATSARGGRVDPGGDAQVV
jgi:hypothetical protein